MQKLLYINTIKVYNINWEHTISYDLEDPELAEIKGELVKELTVFSEETHQQHYRADEFTYIMVMLYFTDHLQSNMELTVKYKAFNLVETNGPDKVIETYLDEAIDTDKLNDKEYYTKTKVTDPELIEKGLELLSRTTHTSDDVWDKLLFMKKVSKTILQNTDILYEITSRICNSIFYKKDSKLTNTEEEALAWIKRESGVN